MFIIPFFMPTFGSNLKTLNNFIYIFHTTDQEPYIFDPMVQSSTGFTSNQQFIFFVIVAIAAIVIMRFNTSKEVTNSKASVDNHHLLSLSNYSKEIVFKFNKRTHDVNFINNNSRLRKNRAYLEETIKTHLPNIEGKGVEIITKKKNMDTLIYKLYYLSSELDSDYIVGKVVDVKEEVELKEKLLEKATVDGLSGLYNATHTKDTIDKLIQNKKIEQKDMLLLVDLDDFKNVNDSLGHLIGDQVIKDVSQALTNAFQGATIIGRIGGDEFMLYLENVESDEAYHSLVITFNEILNALEYPIQIKASIGSCIVEGQMKYEEAFVQADMSLYDLKNIKLSSIENSLNNH